LNKVVATFEKHIFLSQTDITRTGITSNSYNEMFEGIPTYPDASRFWQVIDKHQVNSFYTAPTAIRALMGAGDGFVL
jgi:acyl-coenzyme A synthetase/AMP-(fatty) acid ligase